MVHLNLTYEAESNDIQCDPQRGWIKIEVARERNVTECYRGLRQAYGNDALSE